MVGQTGQVKKTVEKDKMLANIRQTIGQVLLTYSMIEWTSSVEAALKVAETNPQAIKKVRNNYKKKVDVLIECVEKPGLQAVDRSKIVTLIIIEEHNREVIERLHNEKVNNMFHFNWVSQLRYSKDAE